MSDVIHRLMRATFEAQTANPYEVEIKRAEQRILVAHLMELANSPTFVQVRAIASEALREIRSTRTDTNGVAEFDERAHRAQMGDDIKRFLERPFDNMAPVNTPDPPPGAPIGDTGLDYLLGFDSCWWRDSGYWR